MHHFLHGIRRAFLRPVGACLGLLLSQEEENEAVNADLQKPQEGLNKDFLLPLKGDEEKHLAENADLQKPQEGLNKGDLLPAKGGHDANNEDLLPASDGLSGDLLPKSGDKEGELQPIAKGEDDKSKPLPANGEENGFLPPIRGVRADDELLPTREGLNETSGCLLPVSGEEVGCLLPCSSGGLLPPQQRGELGILSPVRESTPTTENKDLHIKEATDDGYLLPKLQVWYEESEFSVHVNSLHTDAAHMHASSACIHDVADATSTCRRGFAKGKLLNLHSWAMPMPRPRVKMKSEILLFYLTTGILDPGGGNHPHQPNTPPHAISITFHACLILSQLDGDQQYIPGCFNLATSYKFVDPPMAPMLLQLAYDVQGIIEEIDHILFNLFTICGGYHLLQLLTTLPCLSPKHQSNHLSSTSTLPYHGADILFYDYNFHSRSFLLVADTHEVDVPHLFLCKNFYFTLLRGSEGTQVREKKIPHVLVSLHMKIQMSLQMKLQAMLKTKLKMTSLLYINKDLLDPG